MHGAVGPAALDLHPQDTVWGRLSAVERDSAAAPDTARDGARSFHSVQGGRKVDGASDKLHLMDAHSKGATCSMGQEGRAGDQPPMS